MSLKLAADHLASKGRGPDTMLVHMAPSEVAGLQSLAKAAGGSLTVNPHTGLPEAGFLESLLPTLIGAGITAATGGAVPAWMLGAGIGGVQALRTGDIGKGLTAGLGAYGGAGLTGGLADMGAASLSKTAGIPQTIVDEFGQQVVNPAYANSTAGFGDKLKAGLGTFDWNNPTDFVGGLGGGSKKMGAAMLGAAALPTVMQALEPQQSPGMGTDSKMPRRLRYDTNTRSYVPISQQEAYNIRGFAAGGMPEWNPKWTPDTPAYGNQGQDFGREILYYNPGAAKQVEDTAAQKPAELLKPVYIPEAPASGGSIESTPDWDTTLSLGQKLSEFGLPTLGDYLQSEARMGINTQTGAYSQEAQNQRAAEAAAAINAANVAQAQAEASERQSGTSAADYGGGAGAPGANADGYGGGDAGFGGGSQAFSTGGLSPLGDNAFAAGGLGSLGAYSDGGRLLRGPGDGVSDSIPATIGHAKQPARLADGEFVVPARIVSELGNGSTEAGARKLYAMMDRIQNARRKSMGKNRVAADSKAHKLLPA